MKIWIFVYLGVWHFLTGFVLDKLEVPSPQDNKWTLLLLIINSIPVWVLVYILTRQYG